MTRAVGIDLGTTYSAIACLDDEGKSQILRNGEGQLLTPSVVFFDKNEIIVGNAAKKAAGIESDRVAQWAKRDIGSEHYARPIGGQLMPPEVIQQNAAVIRQFFSTLRTLKQLAPDAPILNAILDEAAQLGDFHEIAQLYSVMRGYGLCPMCVYQDIGSGCVLRN